MVLAGTEGDIAYAGALLLGEALAGMIGQLPAFVDTDPEAE